MSEVKNQRKSRAIRERFIREFIQNPGQHLLIVGVTGSGKTQTMYWLADLINTHHDRESIVWFDIGKNDEAFKLGEITGKPLRVFLPHGCKIEAKDYEYEMIHFDPLFPFEMWEQIDNKAVNIISVYRFILDPVTYTKTTSEIFRSLIIEAHNYRLKTPLSLFSDEFHNVAPAQSSALDFKQYQLGAWIQVNVEKLRSLGVRLIASTHGWKKLRPGVRSSFNWLIFKRLGDDLGSEQKKLNRFVPLFQSLKTNQSILVFPNRVFTDKIITPFYGETNKMVLYKGIYQLIEEDV